MSTSKKANKSEAAHVAQPTTCARCTASLLANSASLMESASGAASATANDSEQRPRTNFPPEVAVLAFMLARLADLADDVTSNAYSDRDRGYLRSMLPPGSLELLIFTLADLSSERRRQESQRSGWPRQLIIDRPDHALLFADDEESEEAEQA